MDATNGHQPAPAAKCVTRRVGPSGRRDVTGQRDCWCVAALKPGTHYQCSRAVFTVHVVLNTLRAVNRGP